jgi:hypothetical protein
LFGGRTPEGRVRALPGRNPDFVCWEPSAHLLCDADILRAFEQMFACTWPGGGCLITVRDYDREERVGVQMKP